jgi:hypothetical protein
MDWRTKVFDEIRTCMLSMKDVNVGLATNNVSDFIADLTAFNHLIDKSQRRVLSRRILYFRIKLKQAAIKKNAFEVEKNIEDLYQSLQDKQTFSQNTLEILKHDIEVLTLYSEATEKEECIEILRETERLLFMNQDMNALLLNDIRSTLSAVSLWRESPSGDWPHLSAENEKLASAINRWLEIQDDTRKKRKELSEKMTMVERLIRFRWKKIQNEVYYLYE